MNIIKCCYKCDKRSIGCHSKCEEYNNQLQLHKQEQALIRKNKDDEAMVIGTQVNAIKRMREIRRNDRNR